MYLNKTREQIVELMGLMQIKNISLYDLTNIIGKGRVKGANKLSVYDLIKIVESVGVKIIDKMDKKKELFEPDSHIKFSIYSDKKRKIGMIVSGQIIQVTDYFITVRLENYTESYTESYDLFGFQCGDYVILK